MCGLDAALLQGMANAQHANCIKLQRDGDTPRQSVSRFRFRKTTTGYQSRGSSLRRLGGSSGFSVASQLNQYATEKNPDPSAPIALQTFPNRLAGNGERSAVGKVAKMLSGMGKQLPLSEGGIIEQFCSTDAR